jgi:gliding motility-associated-like protein
MRTSLSFVSIFMLLLVGISTPLSAQDCSCVNCPLPINNNSIQETTLEVEVNGPDDLGACPLDRVCFTITHTWVGDLYVTLESPSGLEYMVMADIDNNTNGCGTNANNVDVCITPGTANPLSNNTEYNCNGVPLFNCLTGDWNVPCGGVTDPTGASVQAPNCDLNDFNVPGDPANGVWTLKVHDVCPFDQGWLEDWRLEFACGTLACFACEANAGSIDNSSVNGCEGDPGLDLTINPDYGGGTPPDEDLFGYTYLISQNDQILSVDSLADLTTLAPGTYDVCGLSYELTSLDPYQELPGTSLSDLSATDVYCADLSDSCLLVNVFPLPDVTQLDSTLCFGECFTAPDGTICCSPGTCVYVLPAAGGCDSIIEVNLTILPENLVQQDVYVCPGDCVTIDMVDYCAPGTYDIFYSGANGCDSTFQLNLIESAPTIADPVVDGPATTCTVITETYCTPDDPNTVNYIWTLPPEASIVGGDSTDCIQVIWSATGTFDICVTAENGCVTSAQDCFSVDVSPGVMPTTLNGPGLVCINDQITYSVPDDPNATNYGWLLPDNALLISGGDGNPSVTVEWTSVGEDSTICAFVSNGCNQTAACLNITVTGPVDDPVVSGPLAVCENTTATYCANQDPNISNYSWTIPPTATIIGGVGGPCIDVDWGTSPGGLVCVTASNNCGVSNQVCVNVLVNQPLDEPLISGPAAFCQFDTISFSVNNLPAGTSYDWTLPAIGNLIGFSPDSAQVELTWTGFGQDSICVSAANSCGITSTVCFPFEVSTFPGIGIIAGPDTVCAQSLQTYCIPADPAADSFNWTLPAGAILVSGQGTDCIDVDWSNSPGGPVCVNATNICGSGPLACLDVVVEPLVNSPVLTTPINACLGDTITVSVPADPNVLNTTWTLPANATLLAGGDDSTFVTLILSALGTEPICITAANDCGSSPPACADLVVGEPPVLSAITGPISVCTNESAIYCIDPNPDIAVYQWTFPPGASIVSGQGTPCVTVNWNNSAGGLVCLNATAVCGAVQSVCEGVNVLPDPEPFTVEGPDLFCQGDTILFTVNGGDFASAFNWDVPACATLLEGQGTDSVLVFWPVECLNASVCATAENTCATIGPECIQINALPLPAVDAGADFVVCDTVADLSAVPGPGVGNWTFIAGPGNAQFNNPVDPFAEVTVDQLGTYEFAWTVTENGCSNSDLVTVDFLEPLSVGTTLAESCNFVDGTYIVSFEIISGQGPYMVTGGPGILTGNQFESGPIVAGAPYAFAVTNGLCDTLFVSGINGCICTTFAGLMDPATITACIQDTVTATQLLPGLLGPGDTLMYVLHDAFGPVLGNIIAQNSEPSFFFQPPMTPATFYYISAVAGDFDPFSGFVDFNDPCLSVTSGTPLVFREPPTGSISADSLVCEGEDVLLELELTGEGPFSVTINGTSIPGVMDGQVIPVDPAANTVFVLESITDIEGCIGQVGDSLEVEVIPAPFATVTPSTFICNTPFNGAPTNLNFNNLITDGDASGTWTDIDNSGASGTFPVLDFSYVDTGTFVFLYTTSSAVAPCVEATYTVEVTVEACICPELDMVGTDTVCTGVGLIDLDDYLNTNAPGNWNLISPPAGATNFPVLGDNGILIEGSDGGLYTYGFTLDNSPPPGCPDVIPLELFLQEGPEAGYIEGFLQICQGDVDGLFLLDSLISAQPGGTWEDLNTPPVTGFNTATGFLDASGETAGTYLFHYIVGATAECPADTAIVFVAVNPLPVAQATGAMDVFDCLTEEVTLGGPATSQGPEFAYRWETLDGEFIVDSTARNPVVGEPGTYVLSVINKVTGCVAVDTAIIPLNQTFPELVLTTTEVSCFGESDGSIVIDSIFNGTPPYLVSFENGPFIEQSEFRNLPAGEYKIVVEDVNGCRTSVTTLLIQPQEIVIELFGNSELNFIEILLGDSLYLNARTDIPEELIDYILWSPDTLTNCDSCAVLGLRPEEDQLYTVEVSVGGCVVVDSLLLRVNKDEEYEQANIFAPNRNNSNEFFTIVGGPEFRQVKVLRIFTRWGEMVFENFNFQPNVPSFGWNGRFNGEVMKPGVYVWYAEVQLIDGRIIVLKGDVVLIR